MLEFKQSTLKNDSEGAGVSSIFPSTNYISETNIRLILEWAGEKLLSLPVNSIGPRSIKSSWPTIPTNYILPSKFNTSDQLKITPTNYDIDLIDEIYSIINLVPDNIQRRIIQSRSLIIPLNKRYLISWSRLSRLLNNDRRKIQTIHQSGLKIITSNIQHSDYQKINKVLVNK